MPFVPIFPNACNSDLTPIPTIVFRPWERDNGILCPDPSISPRDLDWRRKAEILKYNKNQNKMTQKQLFKRAATNTLTKRNQTYAVQNLNSNPKLTNPNIKNLTLNNGTLTLPLSSCSKPIKYTTDSDVPGPRIPLTPVPPVPLTRFNQERRRYLGGSEKWPQSK